MSYAFAARWIENMDGEYARGGMVPDSRRVRVFIDILDYRAG